MSYTYCERVQQMKIMKTRIVNTYIGPYGPRIIYNSISIRVKTDRMTSKVMDILKTIINFTVNILYF